jgi:protein subunit release factor B
MRTGTEKRDVQRVLDGELDEFLESSLKHFRSLK